MGIDYNQDGLTDVFLHDVYGSSPNWIVLLAQPDPTFTQLDTGIPRPFPIGSLPPPPTLSTALASVHLADVNGDGVPDLIQCDDHEPPSAPGMSSPPLRPLLASPWLGLPALAAGAALAYALLSLRACEAPPAAAAPAATAVTVAETATSTQPPAGALPSAAPPSPPTAQAAAAPATSAAPTPELGTDEARARLFAIRTALGRGDGGEALALLDRLAQRDRRGTFRQERELLRVEVLARVGRGAEARALLARLRKTMGEDPSLRRVSKVLDTAQKRSGAPEGGSGSP